MNDENRRAIKIRIPIDVLPDVLTEEQKSKKLSNLLQKMKKARIIDVKGIAVNSEWHILTKDKSKNNLVKKS